MNFDKEIDKPLSRFFLVLEDWHCRFQNIYFLNHIRMQVDLLFIQHFLIV